jgi:hypothetical protein
MYPAKPAVIEIGNFISYPFEFARAFTNEDNASSGK